MADTLKLEIVTPESVIYSEDVDMVTLPGSESDTGIYPHHVPLMTKVQAGELGGKRGGAEEILVVGEGVAEITGDHGTALALELQYKAQPKIPLIKSLQPYAFWDFGAT